MESPEAEGDSHHRNPQQINQAFRRARARIGGCGAFLLAGLVAVAVLLSLLPSDLPQPAILFGLLLFAGLGLGGLAWLARPEQEKRGVEAAVSERVACPNCGYLNSRSRVTCKRCRSRIRGESEDSAAPEPLPCPQCGYVNPRSRVTCKQCGVNLVAASAQGSFADFLTLGKRTPPPDEGAS